ncbi:MAG: hypothetical protein RLZZ500_539 [Bacteroidota bacterium]|jgi:hypothetical protein
MHEAKRLQELFHYEIMDSKPEQVLDDLAEVASILCDTPMSLVTMVDDHRTWHKSMYGFDTLEVPREDSFCQHIIEHPKDLLIIEDALLDKKFNCNPYVHCENGIRFYAGAPLVTPNGYVLGSLCVVDTKPRKLSVRQEQGLRILSQKAMDYLNTRKLLLMQNQTLAQHSRKVKRLTDLSPGVLFQYRNTAEGKGSFDFISDGFQLLFPHLRNEHVYSNPNAILSFIHPDDVQNVEKSVYTAIAEKTNWHFIYRTSDLAFREIWHMVKARIEKTNEQETIWYGSIQDITSIITHDKTIGELLFELSHHLRHPVANILGITQQMQQDDLSLAELQEYIQMIAKSAEELDLYIRQQNSYFNDQKKSN